MLLPLTVKVATLQPPAGAGNVVTVLVPGDTEKLTVEGALIITIPDPPAPDCLALLALHPVDPPPPPPPPVLTVPLPQGAFPPPPEPPDAPG